VHLASVGTPVLADKVYSGRDSFRLSDLVHGTEKEKDEVLLHRQALHALRLRFFHPATKQPHAVEAPLPAEFVKTLEALRKYRAAH
jgi:23S rRNA pseudouridine1911/1915/1917 synthase